MLKLTLFVLMIFYVVFHGMRTTQARHYQFRHHLTSAQQYPTHLQFYSFEHTSHPPNISADRTSHPLASEAAKHVIQRRRQSAVEHGDSH